MGFADRHHLFYPKSLWQGQVHRELREHPTSIVIIDRTSHDRLHRRLHSVEQRFRPDIAVVVGMLAVAEAVDGADSLDNVVDRIQAQIGVAKDLGDGITSKILNQQLKLIRPGYVGGKGPAFGRHDSNGNGRT